MNVSTEQLWQWLNAIGDPELPAISIVDLGIVRAVRWQEDACHVTITPTYSGCPAMQVIESSIVDTLRAQGIAQVRVETQLTPAWTTDWMSDAGRQKLAAFGVAPPAEKAAPASLPIDASALFAPPVVVACPQCGSQQTRLVSQFGSTACKALYRCTDCLEPFDYFKPH